jgi:hypothetical protein
MLIRREYHRDWVTSCLTARVQGVAVSKDGVLAIVDGGNHRIQIFERSL